MGGLCEERPNKGEGKKSGENGPTVGSMEKNKESSRTAE